jgi:hypothetical protein
MTRYIATIMLCLSTMSASSQGIKKYSIGNSGASVYFFCDPGTFTMTLTEDSSRVYSGDCMTSDSIHYGIICVSLKESVSVGADAENLLIKYLDFLKTVYHIKQAVGYGKGHQLKNDASTRGVVDYWKDADGDEWKVKGWTNGRMMAVLFAYGHKGPGNTPKLDLFLDGFRFPGM